MSNLQDAAEYFWNLISSMRISDIIDIIIVSVLLYYVFIFIRERRAGKLAIGILFLLLALLGSDLLGMNALNFILQNIMQVGMIAVIIIFQPELRSMLEKMGGNSIKNLNRIGEAKDIGEKQKAIEEICLAASDLSKSKTGALIVLERGTKLGDEIKTGVIVNADVSSFLIKNIFFNKAPLHDGAMIIRDSRVHACGCFLPLSQNADIVKDLGTRHRAGIGISETSDAVVVIVSEETGFISTAVDGKLVRGYDRYSLKDTLNSLMITEERANTPIDTIKRFFGKK
ncbi:Cyclic di-AMP synthase CdaA [bioreactor metagenome]|uniref:Cyclic di-AMP synthase CdaA n=1 Tax=bioreactor metagenome TaxID=1076179 RepID=A0A644ZJ02_9ZZZZ|nr:diadenylate cyclase CdaA [Oscillospiraceae bacterium]